MLVSELAGAVMAAKLVAQSVLDSSTSIEADIEASISESEAGVEVEAWSVSANITALAEDKAAVLARTNAKSKA